MLGSATATDLCYRLICVQGLLRLLLEIFLSELGGVKQMTRIPSVKGFRGLG